MSARVVVHASGALRREAAKAVLREGGPLWLVSARLEAGRALVAELAAETGVVLGVECMTLDRLAARLARPALARAGLGIATTLAVDTAAAAALVALAPSLPRMGPLRASPGMPRAIGRTLEELWAADLAAGAVQRLDPELAAVASYVERTLEAERLVPAARVLEAAIAAVVAGAADARRVLFLDVPLRSRLAGELAQALARTAGATFTVPSADGATLARLEGLEIAALAPAQGPAAIAEQLFGEERRAAPSGVLETIVARSEAAEAAQVAREVVALARGKVPLHRIALVLRRPELARAALEASFRAAGIPLAQRRAARRPDPGGRALLALLACAVEGLSARAFSAYLAFGAMPPLDDGRPPAASANAELRAYDDDEEDEDDEAPPPDPLKAPRRWERLIVEAAVVGGDPERWRRRLEGLRHTQLRSADELERRGGDGHALRREADELSALERFALPLLADLAALPARATLPEHAEAIAALATRALAHPERVLSVLAELAPRARSGEELSLADVVRVLAPRLGSIETRAPAAGVQVVTPEELRGASFDVVLLPGLVERVFPARVPEDPLLPDAARRALGPDLEDAHARAASERLALALAVGAAERRVVALASITTAEGRPRVPSVYFVELLGRRLGRVASGADVAAAMEGAVSLVTTPAAAARASERTVATLRELARLPRPEARGRANHVTERNPMLRAALRRVYRLETPKLGRSDGLVLGDKESRAPLAKHAPSARAFSATALESFAKCPLQFHFKAVLRLEPREEPQALDELDPLLRGSIFHEAQFLALTALRERGALPLGPEGLAAARATLAEVVAALRTELADRLAPAIPRVFHVELDEIEADLREWLARLAADTRWQPRYFELAFGLPPEDGRDPESRVEPAVLDQGLRLRGAIDLVEADAEGKTLRATDHKTGSSYAIRDPGPLVVRGGRTLQPVLYALALTKLFPEHAVAGGRLYYCTTRGRFEERTVPLDDAAREAAGALARAIAEGIGKGLLPALPAEEACAFCDFRLACGPHAAARADRLPAAEREKVLPGLVELRRRR